MGTAMRCRVHVKATLWAQCGVLPVQDCDHVHRQTWSLSGQRTRIHHHEAGIRVSARGRRRSCGQQTALSGKIQVRDRPGAVLFTGAFVAFPCVLGFEERFSISSGNWYFREPQYIRRARTR